MEGDINCRVIGKKFEKFFFFFCVWKKNTRNVENKFLLHRDRVDTNSIYMEILYIVADCSKA